MNRTKWNWGMLVLLLFLALTGTACGRNQEKAGEDPTDAEEGMYSFATGGIVFHVPDQYQTSLSKEWGILISKEGEFGMRLAVEQTAYAVFQENPERMKAVVEQAGYPVTRQPEAVEVNGRDYLYLTFDKEGVMDYLIYTAAGDCTIGILLVCEYEETSKALELADSIAGTAAVTGQPDSTYDEIVLAQVKHTEQAYESEGSLIEEMDNTVIHYQIPEGFYENETGLGEDNAREYYNYMEEGKIDIFVRVQFVNMEEVAEYNGPEDYIRSMAWTDEAAEVSHTVINDYDVYYLTVDRAYIAKEDTEYDYHFYGVIPLENGIFYLVEGRSGSNADAMKLETYMNFLTLS